MDHPSRNAYGQPVAFLKGYSFTLFPPVLTRSRKQKKYDIKGMTLESSEHTKRISLLFVEMSFLASFGQSGLTSICQMIFQKVWNGLDTTQTTNYTIAKYESATPAVIYINAFYKNHLWGKCTHTQEQLKCLSALGQTA